MKDLKQGKRFSVRCSKKTLSTSDEPGDFKTGQVAARVLLERFSQSLTSLLFHSSRNSGSSQGTGRPSQFSHPEYGGSDSL